MDLSNTGSLFVCRTHSVTQQIVIYLLLAGTVHGASTCKWAEQGCEHSGGLHSSRVGRQIASRQAKLLEP